MKRLVIVSILALPLLGGCELAPDFTPEETIQVYELEQELEARTAQVRELEGEVGAAISAYEQAVRRGDAEALEAARLTLSSMVGEYKIASTKAQLAAESIDDVYEIAYERKVGPVSAVFELLPPGPWKFLEFLGLLGPQIIIWLTSRRSRSRLKEGLIAGAKGNLAELAAGILKSVGALHSTPTSGVVAEEELVAKKAAELVAKAETVRARTA